MTLSVHGHICSLFDLNLHVFWWNMFKVFLFLWPSLNVVISFVQMKSEEACLYDPQLVFSIFCTDGSNSFPGYEIKGRKTLKLVEGSFWEMCADR